MKRILLVDFGSTYTKAIAVELESETVLGRSQAPTTFDTDIMIGLDTALCSLEREWNIPRDNFAEKYACSSAAGGLKMAAIGLVPSLTLEAARRSALGAGAKVVCSYGFEINEDIIAEISEKRCDIIMLAGGTDGGNKSVIIHNADILAASDISCPILVCGNQNTVGKVSRILSDGGKQFYLSENVLPTLDMVNSEPAGCVIRDIFIEHIVKAKGLSGAQEYIGRSIIPTPLATLRAAELLSRGTGEVAGIGSLLVVEVGGATTNVHSVISNEAVTSQTILRGLPESFVKRTVEGDLGIRWNAQTIFELAGDARLRDILQGLGSVPEEESGRADFKAYTDNLYSNVEHVPENDFEYELDITLAKAAVHTAVSRHAGTIQKEASVSGEVTIQRGKNLLSTATILATGGIFKYGKDPGRVLQSALFDDKEPWSLRPVSPNFLIDKSYIFYAIGLMMQEHPEAALRIAKRYLAPIDP